MSPPSSQASTIIAHPKITRPRLVTRGDRDVVAEVADASDGVVDGLSGFAAGVVVGAEFLSGTRQEGAGDADSPASAVGFMTVTGFPPALCVSSRSLHETCA